jgi:hypothetical protein
LKKIGIRSFEECYSLKSIQIPESTVFVGERAFRSCGNLERAELLSSCSELGEDVFVDCIDFRGMIVPHGTKSFYRKYTEVEFWPMIKERIKGKLHY